MGDELTRRQVTARLRELLAEILECDAADVGPDDDLVDELDADSLQRLELMTEVEQELGIHLDAGAWRAGRTLGELAELTLQTLAAQPQAR
jgi:acyl carrier protein